MTDLKKHYPGERFNDDYEYTGEYRVPTSEEHFVGYDGIISTSGVAMDIDSGIRWILKPIIKFPINNINNINKQELLEKINNKKEQVNDLISRHEKNLNDCNEFTPKSIKTDSQDAVNYYLGYLEGLKLLEIDLKEK